MGDLYQIERLRTKFQQGFCFTRPLSRFLGKMTNREDRKWKRDEKKENSYYVYTANYENTPLLRPILLPVMPCGGVRQG